MIIVLIEKYPNVYLLNGYMAMTEKVQYHDGVKRA
ncbi:hypothetical protein EV213_103315 [Aureibacillus halotolerans]|uniref:Uncharacterized protein n=1 Tax=Aureibacillus halotolerans TaxID=1508390 RepID=A0A4R6UA43_9BACI|nr:hypothetical protein EV213_103315 [Aureibacillus halotolerans]